MKNLKPAGKKEISVPCRRDLYALAKEMMSMPCNRSRADKTFVYESQAAYNAYFRELNK